MSSSSRSSRGRRAYYSMDLVSWELHTAHLQWSTKSLRCATMRRCLKVEFVRVAPLVALKSCSLLVVFPLHSNKHLPKSSDSHQKINGKLKASYRKVTRQSSESHRQVIGNSLDSHGKVIGKSSERSRKSSASHREVIGKSLGSHRKVIGQSSES